MEVKPEDLEKARAFFVPQPGDQDITAKIRREGQELSPTVKYHECRDLSFDTDFPNQGEANRRVFKAIAEELKAARTSILAESPYFVIKPGGYAVLENLKEREIAMTFLTNGLHSTDAFYTVASLFFNAGWLAKTRMTLYAFKGDSIQPDQSPETFGARDRWGIHSKRAVLDDHTVMVGTYNIDPRSANLNSELMVICRNQPELAKEFTQKIQARIAASRLVIDKGYADRWALLGGSSLKQILIFLIALPVSNLFDFLL
jgi:cardiolipin synthase C